MALSVFLAEDHQILIEGFRSGLAKHGIDVLGVTSSLDDLPERFTESCAKTLVINVRWLSNNGIETCFDACQKLLDSHPEANIVMFSHFESMHSIETVYKTGAKAFFLTSEGIDVMSDAIRAAADGKKFLSPQAAQMLAESSLFCPNPAQVLNERELRVFILLADGALKTEAARELDVARKTVSEIVKSIDSKLGLDNVADYTKLAIRYGMTSTTPKRDTPRN